MLSGVSLKISDMKKVLIISGVAILLLGILGVFAYLLLNGRPGPAVVPDSGADFQISGEADIVETTSEEVPDSVVIEDTLTKLVSGPVAGATFFVRDGDSYIRFVERGTGHIYEIDLGDGSIEQISGTTIPRVVDAHWEPNGWRSALSIERSPYETEYYIARLERTDDGGRVTEGFQLLRDAGVNVHSLDFDETGNVLFYVLKTESGSVGYRHEITTGEKTVLFEVPFSQIRVLWGDPIYIYNSPSASLIGHLYEVSGNTVTKVAEGRGLTAQRQANVVVVATAAPNGTSVESIDTNAPNTDPIRLALGGYPEKCDFDHASTTLGFFCAEPLAPPAVAFPDAWYQGALTMSDGLWSVDLGSGDATLLSILSDEAGEQIDVTDLMLDVSDTYALFINKIDGALWLYRFE